MVHLKGNVVGIKHFCDGHACVLIRALSLTRKWLHVTPDFEAEGSRKIPAVSRWSQKAYSSCKNLNDEPLSGHSKTVDSEVVPQATDGEYQAS